MKRFRKTGTGKVRRYQAFTNHILTKKTSKRKRALRRGALVHPADLKRIKRLLLM
jgi:large subunit ribosomal protein L35